MKNNAFKFFVLSHLIASVSAFATPDCFYVYGRQVESDPAKLCVEIDSHGGEVQQGDRAHLQLFGYDDGIGNDHLLDEFEGKVTSRDDLNVHHVHIASSFDVDGKGKKFSVSVNLQLGSTAEYLVGGGHVDNLKTHKQQRVQTFIETLTPPDNHDHCRVHCH